MREINQGKDQRIGESMVHEVDQFVESTIQNDRNDRQDKGKMRQESSNPALHIQICDDEEQGDNNEVTSKRRKIFYSRLAQGTTCQGGNSGRRRTSI